jgi:hypothetical protein
MGKLKKESSKRTTRSSRSSNLHQGLRTRSNNSNSTSKLQTSTRSTKPCSRLQPSTTTTARRDRLMSSPITTTTTARDQCKDQPFRKCRGAHAVCRASRGPVKATPTWKTKSSWTWALVMADLPTYLPTLTNTLLSKQLLKYLT